MQYDTLEDFFGDIVGKARRGQGIEEGELAAAAGLTSRDISRIESYDLVPENDTIVKLAAVLNLDGQKLVGIARGWVPEGGNDPHREDSLRVSRVILDAGMTVNAYVLRCEETGKGAVVDAGGQPDRILSLVEEMNTEITHVLLTHGHGDHVGALGDVKSATGACVCCCERDFGHMGGRSSSVDVKVDEGWTATVGEVVVAAVSLPGHTPGGIGYRAGGVVFTGDALFAGSLGGARGSAYSGQIQAVRNRVLAGADTDRVFPGHGPATTVGQEKAHNPYFV